MAPQIQYTKTEDGISIAYWTMGSGPPLVHLGIGPATDIVGELALDEVGGWYERLSRTHTLVRYDERGCGSSDRNLEGVSLETMVLDLKAVIDALGLERVDLLAGSVFVPVAIAFASQNPDRVDRIVLWGGFARNYQARSRLRATRTLIMEDWPAYTDAWAQFMFGWSYPERAKAWSRLLRGATSPQCLLATVVARESFDVSGLLSQITAPVLVVDHRQRAVMPDDASRVLASGFPNARLAVLEGRQIVPWADPDNMDRNVELVLEFLGVSAAEAVETPVPSGTAIILFADIADSTALTERLGDAAFRDKARALDEALRAAIASNGGKAIEGKLLGDGVLAIFGAAREAIACAAACHSAAQDVELALHVGVHAGDVIHEQGNVFGGAVNIAARVASEAGAGETLVSATVRDLARTSAGVAFEDRGERELKGVSEPVRVWAVV